MLRVIWFLLKHTRLDCALRFGIDSSRYYSPADHVLVEKLINKLLVCMLTSIANEIVPCVSGVDSSWDCTRVDCVLVETLINKLLACMLTSIANEIAPSGSEVDSSWDCSRVHGSCPG